MHVDEKLRFRNPKCQNPLITRESLFKMGLARFEQFLVGAQEALEFTLRCPF